MVLDPEESDQSPSPCPSPHKSVDLRAVSVLPSSYARSSAPTAKAGGESPAQNSPEEFERRFAPSVGGRAAEITSIEEELFVAPKRRRAVVSVPELRDRSSRTSMPARGLIVTPPPIDGRCSQCWRAWDGIHREIPGDPRLKGRTAYRAPYSRQLPLAPSSSSPSALPPIPEPTSPHPPSPPSSPSSSPR